LSIPINSVGGLFDSSQETLFIRVVNLPAETLLITKLTHETENESREAVVGFNMFPLGLILACELLGFLGHVFYVFLRNKAFLICDCDRFRLAAKEINDVSV
jgi:hypothetical protein